jgi:hypothetical protein
MPMCRAASRSPRYAELAGLPVAALGPGGYLAILATTVRDDALDGWEVCGSRRSESYSASTSS